MQFSPSHDLQEVVAIVRDQDQFLIKELDKQLGVLETTSLAMRDVVSHEAASIGHLNEVG